MFCRNFLRHGLGTSASAGSAQDGWYRRRRGAELVMVGYGRMVGRWGSRCFVVVAVATGPQVVLVEI